MKTSELLEALNLFSTVEQTSLPHHFIQTLLLVAEHEPCQYRVIEEGLCVSGASVSRTMTALSFTNRKKNKGYGLVRIERDPAEGRRYVALLTPKGRAFIRAIQAI